MSQTNLLRYLHRYLKASSEPWIRRAQALGRHPVRTAQEHTWRAPVQQREGSLPGSRKSDQRSPRHRVGGFKALDSQIDREVNTVLGAVKSPLGSRCSEQSPLGRWRQGKAAAAVRVQRAAGGAVALHEVVVACESPQYFGQQSSD